MTTKRSDTEFDLCKFAYSDGRYCGLPAMREYNGFCRSHGQLEKFHNRPPVEYNEDLTSYIDPFTNDPPNQDEVHSALARVFRALATNRISTRRAATLGYLGQLLLLKKRSKEDRDNINNLSRMFAKSLDLAYNPKAGTTAPHSAQAQNTNPAPAAPQLSPPKPSNPRPK
jgi:hypothetical protein